MKLFETLKKFKPNTFLKEEVLGKAYQAKYDLCYKSEETKNYHHVELVIDKGLLSWEDKGTPEEYTYIMEDSAFSAYKIGKTKNNPETRLKQFQTGNPSIKLVMVFPSSIYSEAYLHAKFEDYKKIEDGDSGSEWFYKTEALKNFVRDHINLKVEIEALYIKYEAYQSALNNLLTTLKNQ